MHDPVLVASPTLVDEQEDGQVAIRLAPGGLDRCCLDLCITLLDHSLPGDIFQSILVSAMATLGIDSEQRGFQEPVNYTS